MKNGRHTTGCYATNVFGEPLTSLYILDSKTKYPENFKIYPRIGKEPPVVHGKYENDTAAFYDSLLAVRKKGGMDRTLWEKVPKEIILPLYKNTSPRIERCARTNKILK